MRFPDTLINTVKKEVQLNVNGYLLFVISAQGSSHSMILSIDEIQEWV